MGKISFLKAKYGKFDAVTAPLKTNDSTQGYEVGSPWVDTAHFQIYTCVSPLLNEAIWKLPGGQLVRNPSGPDMYKGQVVWQAAAQGGTPTVSLAKADAEPTSAGTWALLVEDLPTGGFAYVLSNGPLYTLDTSSFSDGDALWLSATVSGGKTNVDPDTPNHSVFIGHVNLSHANAGIINVNIANGHEMKEMHDVLETNPQAGDIIIKNNDNTYYINDQALVQQNDSGIVSWSGTGDYYDEAFLVSDNKLKLLRAPTGRIKSKQITVALPQETAAFSANTTNFIYIDSTGSIQATTTRTHALYRDNIILFEVLYDGSVHEVVREDHPYDYDVQVSNDQHDTQGTVFELDDLGILERVTTGTGSVATDRQAKQVGESEIHDQGIESILADSSGSGVVFKHYYTNASGKYIRNSSSATFPMLFNSSGTPTAITTAPDKYGIFRIALSKDDLNNSPAKLFSLMHTAEFSTLTQAQTAIANGDVPLFTNELKALELAEYGFIIVRNTAAGGHIQEIQIQKRALGGTISTGGSSQASQILTETSGFDEVLSSLDTNVQAALQTINDAGLNKGVIIFPFYDGGNILATGEYAHLEITIPYGIDIYEAQILGDQTGSIVIELWADSYANYPPTVADKITATDPPTVTSAIKSKDTDVSSWDHAQPADTKIRPNIVSNTAFTDVKLIIKYNKTGV
ncbi:MAG: hypothetical protein KAS66_00235 [Candidatus Omnitrophica bacterium]|nr:hypothetical protein [Candidatus Omnitrophota bacterium]